MSWGAFFAQDSFDFFCHCFFFLFERQAHKGLTQMLKKYTFVGMVDVHLSLLQFNTKLVLVNHTELRQDAPFTLGGRVGKPAACLRNIDPIRNVGPGWGLPVIPLRAPSLDLNPVYFV